MEQVTRIVVLDDYQQIAASYVDWSSLGAEVDFVTEHLAPDALVDRAAGAQVLVAMRERTALPAAVLDRLPGLELIVTTGMNNASIDLAHARARGITVCGTGGRPGAAGGADLGADPRPPAPRARGRPRAAGRGLAGRAPRRRARRQHARSHRSGPARPARRTGWARLRDGGACLVAEPRPRPGPRPRGRAVRQGRPVAPLRRGLAPPAAQRPHARHPGSRRSSPG